MSETKFDLSKVSFEDVVGESRTPLPSKKDDTLVVPDKPDDALALPAKKDDNTIDNADPENQETFYESMSKILGYEVEGEFDESVEGVAEYTKAVGQKIAEEEVRDLFESYPDVKEYLQFRLNNGDPQKYFQTKFGDVDFSTYNVTEGDEATQEAVVRKYLFNDGYKAEQINEIVKDYKETNLLFKQAKRFAERLTETQRSQKEDLIKNQEVEAREAEFERQQVVAEISQTIEKGNLHNIVIPEKDRKEFRAWLLQTDNKGQTRRQLTMKSMSLDQKLQLEYLAFKGFDLKDLVKREATQTKIDFLKKSTNKSSRLAGAGENGLPKKNSPLTGLKLSDIL